MAGIVADIESTIGVIQGVIGNYLGVISSVESVMAAAQATLMESQYLAAIPIIIAEFKGLVDIIVGSGELFIGSIESLEFFIPDFFDGLITLGAFSISWMMCLFQNLANMQTCIIYYLLETIGQILYLPFRILFWIIFKIGFEVIYDYEKVFWDKMDELDKIIMGFTGFHITHYPKNIREKCYNCKRLKISTLLDRTKPLMEDVTDKLPRKLWPGINHIIQGGTELMHPFDF
uniref:Uncharacterized protein n=1 Tax=viral metagenome TaxID=1070528 RepID=A0A6C0JDP8_9ZZZZ